MLQHPVASHAVEEATERAACGVLLPRISHQHHKDILDNLFVGPRVSRHAQREAVKRRLMAPIKERKGLLVALSRAREQHVVSFLVGDAHLPRIRRSARPSMYIPAASAISSRCQSSPRPRKSLSHNELDVSCSCGVAGLTGSLADPPKSLIHLAVRLVRSRSCQLVGRFLSFGLNSRAAVRVTKRRGTRRSPCAPR